MTPLQWQVMMKCWKMSLKPALRSWWGQRHGRVGAVGAWLWKLRKMNGPNFTWPLLMFSSALPEWLMAKMGKIYRGRPMQVKAAELLAAIKQHWRYLREDAGDLPDGWAEEVAQSMAAAANGGGAMELKIL
jgi:hypothetical protein